MATQELTLSEHQAAKLLLALRAVERLPSCTEDIIQATDEGEPYETLCRQIRGLHANLVQIAEVAAQASLTGMPTVEALTRFNAGGHQSAMTCPGRLTRDDLPILLGDGTGDKATYAAHAARTSARPEAEVVGR